ncbi:hypothetical protein RIF29_16772 [Crotalaria pallida]|uniref:Uncharacterized protein n=1 Tax=Crotalaria pallida TaxID=3830 RepID=A0AAN9FFV0_CROPI
MNCEAIPFAVGVPINYFLHITGAVVKEPSAVHNSVTSSLILNSWNYLSFIYNKFIRICDCCMEDNLARLWQWLGALIGFVTYNTNFLFCFGFFNVYGYACSSVYGENNLAGLWKQLMTDIHSMLQALGFFCRDDPRFWLGEEFACAMQIEILIELNRNQHLMARKRHGLYELCFSGGCPYHLEVWGDMILQASWKSVSLWHLDMED